MGPPGTGTILLIGTLAAGAWALARRQERARAEARREALHRALHAEIAAVVGGLVDRAVIEAHAEAVLRSLVRDPGFVPSVPRIEGDRVFAALLPQLPLLPRATIGPVIRYYAQIAALRRMAEDMRGPAYAALEVDRRAVIYVDYVDMLIEALARGRQAMTLIRLHADLGDAAAEARAARMVAGVHEAAAPRRPPLAGRAAAGPAPARLAPPS